MTVSEVLEELKAYRSRLDKAILELGEEASAPIRATARRNRGELNNTVKAQIIRLRNHHWSAARLARYYRVPVGEITAYLARHARAQRS